MKDILASLGLTDLPELNLGALTLEAVLSALAALVICLIGMRLVMSVFRKLLSRTQVDERVRRYSLGGIRVVLWVVTVLIVADTLGIPVTSLIALLSVFSLAVSLAVQSVLANIAGGIVLMISKPFKEGDFVETSSGTGEVLDITLNYTYLETVDGQRVVVPNSTLSADRIINYTTLGKRRVSVNVSASYDTPTELVRRAGLLAIERTALVLPEEDKEVLVVQYGPSAIDYRIRVWCKPDDYGDVLYPLTENIREAFREVGAEMSYDHLNVHMIDK